MSLRLILPLAVLAGFLSLLLLLGRTDTVHAQTFAPTYSITLDDPTPGASSNFVTDFGIAEGDVNFAAVVAYIPPEWGVIPGDQIPIGTEVGFLTSDATLGIINGACDNALTVEFTFLNASIDINDTVPFEDTDEPKNEHGETFDDKDGNGLFDAVDKYPEFLTRVLIDENGGPAQPLRRAAGYTIVAGTDVLLQFVLFEPGTVLTNPYLTGGEIPFDESLGYPTVVVLQNASDPDVEPVPGPITDFCTPLTSKTTTLATAEDGTVLLTNPTEPGTYTFTIESRGLRDADGDSYENFLDTCAFTPNQGDPRVKGDVDADEDGLPTECDPDDDPLSPTGRNSDEDNDGYLNRQDNCPLIANGEEDLTPEGDPTNQADADKDFIGDLCDTPDLGKGCAVPDGELSLSTLTQDVTIGGGGARHIAPPEDQLASIGQGLGNNNSAISDHKGDSVPNPTPTCPEFTGEIKPTGGTKDDGGLGTGVIIGIVVAVVAAVVVIGGGAAFAMRRRS